MSIDFSSAMLVYGEVAVAPIALAMTRCAIAFAGVLIISGLVRVFKRGYLRDWLAAAAALSISSGGEAVSLLYDSNPLVKAGATSVATVTAFAASLWLFLGSYHLVRRHPLRIKLERHLMVLLGVLAGVILLLPLQLGDLVHQFVASGVRLTVVSAFALAAGVVIWNRKSEHHVSFGVLSLSLVAMGVNQLLHLTYLIARVPQPLGHYIPDVLLDAAVLIAMVVAIFADAREEAEQASSQIETLAYYDSLTGLPNRALFYDRLILAIAQAHRYKHRLAVVFFDLDHFKDINDSLGHATGDGLLKAIANSVRDSLRLGDTLARFGGDEFIVLLPRIRNMREVEAVAEKILDSVRKPVSVGQHALLTSTSIGIAVYPDDAADSGALVMNADTAMYRAKETGRDRFVFYAPPSSGPVLARGEIESQLREALRAGQIQVYYQPIVLLSTGATAGFEALLRWKHPSLGLLLPGEFLSMAEVSGLIIPVGNEVLRDSTRAVAKWNSTTGDHLFVSVNISPRQLTNPEFGLYLASSLEAEGFDPSLLHVEVNESDAMRNTERVLEVFRELKASGFRVSIDNFGAASFSLAHLHQMPIDCLKIDRTIVAEVDRGEGPLVSAMVALAKTLNLTVIAEGVERQSQAEILTASRCDMAQGNFFSAPIAGEAVPQYLERKNDRAVQEGPEIVTA